MSVAATLLYAVLGYGGGLAAGYTCCGWRVVGSAGEG
jgi:hypothetical protein